MTAKLQQWKNALCEAAVASRLQAEDYRTSARIGLALGALAGHAYVAAQGFTKAFKNLEATTGALITVLVLLGMLGGLGMVLGGLYSAYKKYDDKGRGDVGWGRIALQVGAGGMAMALAWVGTNVVETLGGSPADIGKGFQSGG